MSYACLDCDTFLSVWILEYVVLVLFPSQTFVVGLISSTFWGFKQCIFEMERVFFWGKRVFNRIMPLSCIGIKELKKDEKKRLENGGKNQKFS